MGEVTGLVRLTGLFGRSDIPKEFIKPGLFVLEYCGPVCAADLSLVLVVGMDLFLSSFLRCLAELCSLV